jgi:hypothetical protein
MKNNVYIKLGMISVLLFLTHYLITTYVLLNYFIDGIYKIHLFLGITTFVIVFLIQKVTKVDPTNFGKGFMVSVVLKMLSVIIFLWSTISGSSENKKMYVVHFFIVFFIYLITEVKLLISTIKK